MSHETDIRGSSKFNEEIDTFITLSKCLTERYTGLGEQLMLKLT
jgi:hypothetical protein